MIRTHLAHFVDCAVSDLVRSKQIPFFENVQIELADTKNPEHGDYSCNLALIASKKLNLQPRAFAELLKTAILAHTDIATVEIAGPGFLNFRMVPAATAKYLADILAKGDLLAQSETENPQKIDVEFVSVNPNGPITVGSGRGAAFGDTLCRVLSAAGHTITREYYINDGVNSEQMRLFAESVLHYAKEAFGKPSDFPENGYKGDYVADVAAELVAKHGKGVLDHDLNWFQSQSQNLMLKRQAEDLARFNVVFDVVFGEQTLHDRGSVQECLDELKQKGVAYEEGGALWLRSTQFGDDKDRVLVRSDGRPTYIASDIAYHRDKFSRGYDRLIDILGPDHHGYIGRMNAAIASSGFSLDRFQIVIFQIVRFVKDGQPAPMRKRDGNIYELRDLMNEVGPDVARYFYLMRSHETHMDFDIDLATKKSDDNPVFYVQYAHARICSVMRKAAESGFEPPKDVAGLTGLLTHPKEGALIRKICDLPYETARCAADYGVHRLTTYATDLARTYHGFYDSCRVIQPEEPELTKARLALCEAAKIGLKATFDLLGISAPERMDREVAVEPGS